MNRELSAFRQVDFRSVRLLKEVWSDAPESEVSLQELALSRFDDALGRLRSTGKNQKGLVIIGGAGSGKTHTLGQIRRHAATSDAFFVLIDCTDILDFWPALALQYMQSLQQEYVNASGKTVTQIDALLSRLAHQAFARQPAHLLRELAEMSRDRLVQLANCVVAHLKNSHAARIKERHGTVRALFYVHASDQNLSDLGYAYLQGQKLDPLPDSDAAVNVTALYLGGENSPKAVVADLAWLMSLSQPAVLAFDQLDPIVNQHRLLAADENHESQAIIQGVVNGLMSLMEKLERTLPVASMLEASWEALRKWGLSSAIDRFEPAITLDPPRDTRQYEQIVRQRLDRTYRAEGFTPPYPTWPFTAAFFESIKGQSPRQVLNRCERHRQSCLAANAVTELCGDEEEKPKPPPPPPPRRDLDRAFARFKAAASVSLPDEGNEDQVGRELADVCELFLKELPLDPDIDYAREFEFHETKKYQSLHFRLRRIFHNESDREEHVCVRVLEKTNFKAFQVRFDAARTMSGVKEGLAGRTLVLLRNRTPNSPAIQTLLDEFRGGGGRVKGVTSADLVTFSAVRQLRQEFPNECEAWLRQTRPLSQTAFFRSLAPTWMTVPQEPPGAALPAQPPAAVPPEPKAELPVAVAAAAAPNAPGAIGAIPPPKPASATAPPPSAAEPEPRTVLAGLRDGLTSQPIEFPVIDLTRHVVIRAGSGGGKTVLLKRLVEEAALAGVSSILIDSARDLSFLGDRWPEKPEGWLEGDGNRAERYLRDVRVRIWTPGRRDGRPLFLSPLPDFRSPFEDQVEFDNAVQIATDGLGPLLIAGRNRTQPMAVLQSAMKHFALQGRHDLQDLADILQNLPDSATPNISRAGKLAQEMGDQLTALMLRDPMLSPDGQPLDIGELFAAAGRPPTVSVMSLFALSDLSSQAAFIGRLAMAVFDWIRRNPARDGLRGLFVLDEAAPFLPSRSSAESKPALILLSQQARKYGVGLLLATQNPMDLDYNATAQFATQFFGTANQPQVVRYIEEILEQRGLRNLNPSALKPGWFYVSAPSLRQPVRLQAPMCLSWHPRNRTPSDDEILERVRRDAR